MERVLKPGAGGPFTVYFDPHNLMYFVTERLAGCVCHCGHPKLDVAFATKRDLQEVHLNNLTALNSVYGSIAQQQEYLKSYEVLEQEGNATNET